MAERKKKVLCTGSGGFIFGNFIRQAFYTNQNYSLVSIDRIRSSNSIWNVYVNSDHQFYIADIRDAHVLNMIFQVEKPDVVVHGAAESFVDKSISNSQPFITSNILGTQNIIDACLKWDVGKLVYVSCYDEETKVVTKNGIIKYSEISPGDTVLSINPNSGIIEEKEVEKVIIQDYNGDMVSFSGHRANLLTTPNHRFIVRSNDELVWKTATDLELDNDFYFPTGKIASSSELTINVPGIGAVDSKALFYTIGAFIGDGFTAYQERSVRNKSGFIRPDFIKKSRNQKTGKFTKISGGPNKESICHSYRVWFDVPKNDKCRKSLEKNLKTLGISFKSQKNKSGEHIYFTSEAWMEYFNQFGKGAYNKQIPEWVFSHGYDNLFNLWLGIHDSDGHGYKIKGRNVSITTVSERLKDGLLYLGQMIGFNTRYETRHSESNIDGRKVSGSSYIVYFSNKRNIRVPKSSRKHYNGKIWCLKVKDNKNFLIERNGRTFFSGNTDEVYGHLENEEDESWTEEACLNPRNPYAASKAAGELLVKAAHQTHGLSYNITRACNCYGPWQHPEKFIPKIIESVLQGKKMPVYGKGLQMRDWMHVHDKCSAIFSIINDGYENEVYNISAGQEFTNIEVFQIVCNTLGKGHDLIEFVEDRPGHDFRYSINSDKLRKLGWSPGYKFREGIISTCQWYVNNQFFFRQMSNQE